MSNLQYTVTWIKSALAVRRISLRALQLGKAVTWHKEDAREEEGAQQANRRVVKPDC